MKSDWSHIEQFRVREAGPWSTREGDRDGMFSVPLGKTRLRILASQPSEEIPWEHVSVSAVDYKGGRCPTWAEMCAVKALFWGEEECVIQFHPPASEYVNNHPNCLHLWKPAKEVIPMPPSIAVGFLAKSATP